MSTITAANAALSNEELQSLLLAASRGADRRDDTRHPFFTMVMLRMRSGPTSFVSVFSREISCGGIGLLHSIPLQANDVYEIDLRVGDVHMRRNAQVVWCRPAGDCWYLSGCRFV